MQAIKFLTSWLQQQKSNTNGLFLLQDFRALFSTMSEIAFKTLMSRAENAGLIERICRGLYRQAQGSFSDGLLLFYAAAYLRSQAFNYISLETVLSDAGIISQLPMNTITIMSSGRSNIINCGRYGTIMFVHTKRHPTTLMDQLHYDSRCHLWRASVSLALSDMKKTHRNMDLIDWEVANEFI